MSGFIFCKPELFVTFGVNVNALNALGRGLYLVAVLLPEYQFVQLRDTQSPQDGPHRKGSADWHLLWEPLRVREHHYSLTGKGQAKEEGTGVNLFPTHPQDRRGLGCWGLCESLHSCGLALRLHKEGKRDVGKETFLQSPLPVII